MTNDTLGVSPPSSPRYDTSPAAPRGAPVLSPFSALRPQNASERLCHIPPRMCHISAGMCHKASEVEGGRRGEKRPVKRLPEGA